MLTRARLFPILEFFISFTIAVFPQEVSSKSVGESRLINHHDFHDHVEMQVNYKTQTESKFLTRQDQKSMRARSKHKAVCVKNMGEIGGMWPTPQRGHWFPNEGDIASFRARSHLYVRLMNDS